MPSISTTPPSSLSRHLWVIGVFLLAAVLLGLIAVLQGYPFPIKADTISQEAFVRYYPGSDIRTWGLPIITIPAGHYGLHAFNNPDSTGGEQALVRDPFGQLWHYSNPRPSVYRRLYYDDFFDQQENIPSLEPANGISFISSGIDMWSLRGSWPSGSVALFKSVDWGKTWTQQESWQAVGVTRQGIVSQEGYLIFPVHYDNTGVIKTGRIISYNQGVSWSLENVSSTPDMVEPAVANKNNTQLWVMRRENTVEFKPPYYLWQGFPDALPLDAVPPVQREHGSPPALKTFKDGNILLEYAHGQNSNFFEIWQSANGTIWTLLARPHADFSGINDALRYASIEELGDRMLITAGEPDNPTRATQQLVVWTKDIQAVELAPGPHIAALQPPSGDFTFDLYLTQTATNFGADTTILFRDANDKLIGGWQIGGAGLNQQVFMFAKEGITFIGKDMQLNKESRLRIQFSGNTMTYWFNDLNVGQGTFVDGNAGPITKVVFFIQDGISTFRIRDQKLFSL